ncbi:MAG: hypothetical protein DRR08_26690 [Candidatus Parabeggiatoa sp. nov. 2]|nr:MAG: hypothetical protein B6247_25925 [Beggiatoa sp. 4572_84]RKZ54214.1 MAG: hypothetical protein DRR08_26690 [Gammaproteobacteria bacterium]
MRKNRILGVAIAAALSLQVGVAQAAGSFKNVSQASTGTVDAAAGDGKILTDNILVASFDNISSGSLLLDVPATGIIYATELFGGESSPTLPKTKMAAVLYTVDGPIDKNFNMRFTLSAGKFAEDPNLAISDKDNDYKTLIGKTSGGKGSNSVNFFVSAQSNKLGTDDQLMLAYQITEANEALATGGFVKLTAELKTPSDLPVNPPREVTIATSKQAVTAELTIEDTGTVKISVSDNSKKFTGNGNPFVSETTARIGYLKITNHSGGSGNPNIMGSDGETLFKVGETGDGALNVTGESTGSTLVISGGQFAASKTAPGQVFLNATTAKVVANPVEDEAATFKLTDADFPNLSTDTNIAIQMTADGSTAINTVENQPEATLKLDFKEAYVKDIEVGPVKLRQIGKDGTVCVVYIVPASSVAIEKINIRITNDSQEAGTLEGKLYNTETGDLIGSGFLNGTDDPLGAGKTVVYQATHLEDKIGTWEGRAMLEIISTLPSLEVLPLMRNQRDRSLLTNIGKGATGSSCSR